jgi:hypothetical protein
MPRVCWMSPIGPTISRTRIVMATAAMLMSAIWERLRPNSPLMTGISGAQANQAKKHTKKAIQVRWKARIGGVAKEKSLMLLALVAMFIPLETKRRPHKPGLATWFGRTPLSVPVRRWTNAKMKGIAIDPLQGYQQEACHGVSPGEGCQYGRAHHCGARVRDNDAVRRECRRWRARSGSGPTDLTPGLRCGGNVDGGVQGWGQIRRCAAWEKQGRAMSCHPCTQVLCRKRGGDQPRPAVRALRSRSSLVM